MISFVRHQPYLTIINSSYIPGVNLCIPDAISNTEHLPLKLEQKTVKKGKQSRKLKGEVHLKPIDSKILSNTATILKKSRFFKKSIYNNVMAVLS